MALYQERPPAYDAMQYDGANAAAVKAWADTYDPDLGAYLRVNEDDGSLGMYSEATGGWFNPDPGVWVLLCNELGLGELGGRPIQLREDAYFTSRFQPVP